jgi:hypothetical protein
LASSAGHQQPHADADGATPESLGFAFSVSVGIFVGALVVSIVSMLLNAVVGDRAKA